MQLSVYQDLRAKISAQGFAHEIEYGRTQAYFAD
jgi:hypothetical protein